jgi:hypothetical protein
MSLNVASSSSSSLFKALIFGLFVHIEVNKNRPIGIHSVNLKCIMHSLCIKYNSAFLSVQ